MIRLEKVRAIGVAALVAAVGCSSSSSSGGARGDGGAGGASSAGCPASSPTDKTACSLSSGTRCSYGCSTGGPSTATCTNSVWSVSQSAIACQAPSADCRKDADCAQGQYCAAQTPGGIVYCSTRANDTLCSTDSDCGDGGPGALICESYTCPSGTGRSCFPGCTDAQCGPTNQTGLVCGKQHRCEAESCQSSSDCPTNFDCNAGHCQRRTCTTDSTCQGYCVNGTCGGALGTCELPRG